MGRFLREVAFRVLVVVHMAIVIGVLSSMFVLPFLTPWYVALPMLALLVNFIFSSVPCPLTRLEDWLRRSLGKRPIKHFVGYYIVWPLKARLGLGRVRES